MVRSEWQGKVVVVDFDYSSVYWRYEAADTLSQKIYESVVTRLAMDKIFRVQDRATTAGYLYRVELRIASPFIAMRNGETIESVSATFRLKIYDASNSLVSSKNLEIRADAGTLAVSANNGQQALLDGYSRHAGAEIRKTFYEGLLSQLEDGHAT